MKYTPSIYFIEKKERKKNEIPFTAASTKIAKSRERWEPVNFQEFIGARREGWFSTVMTATSMLTPEERKSKKETGKRKSGKL